MVNREKYPILSVLEEASIAFELYEHPAVFTVEQGKGVVDHIPGGGTKNLFLTDKKSTKFALLFVEESKRVALKELKDILGWDKVSFASAENLKKYLVVDPGSVTPMAIFGKEFSEHPGKVEVLFDNALLDFDTIQMHPMINSATVVVSSKEFLVELFRKHQITNRGIDVPVVSAK